MARPLDEVLRAARRSQSLRAEHLDRINNIVFNLDEEDLVSEAMVGRLLDVVGRVRGAHNSATLASDASPAYIALLGTLQNQYFFTTKQCVKLQRWLAEAIAVADNTSRLSQLEHKNQQLREQCEKLHTLRQAVLVLRNVKRAGQVQPQQQQGCAAASSTDDACRAAATPKEPSNEHMGPQWQVEADHGFKTYDKNAQEAIVAAAAAGTMSCEIFTNRQFYQLDFSRMVQLNPLSLKERTIRVLGGAPPTPLMPKLNFRRLMMEFRQVEKAVVAKEEPGLLFCEPVEDSLMEWTVQVSFPEGSVLQASLDNLAAGMFNETLNRVMLCIRFPVEYPMSPPEIWLRQPRMKHQCGPVSFGGKICTLLLATAGWQPRASMLTVLREVRQALHEADLEANTEVSIRREYPRVPPQLQRLKSELYATANGFCKDGMTMLSPAEASPLLGDLSRLEATDKIGLPFSYADSIYSRAEKGGSLVLPLIFEIKTLLGRKTHCAIFEFIEGLPEGHAVIPKWVMDDLSIEEHEPVRVRCVSLDLITFAKVQPHSVIFYQAVRDSGCEVQHLLQESLSRFSALTEDTAVPIMIGDEQFPVQIVELRPHASVRIIDTEVHHHFEFEVDFEPAPDLEDESAVQTHQDKLLETLRLRREQAEEGREDIRRKRAAARTKRLQQERVRLQNLAGADGDGQQGGIEVVLRLPTGTKVQGVFRQGAPGAALAAFALATDWAEQNQPWRVHLRAFPNRTIHEEDALTADLHRALVSVQEEEAPKENEALFAVLEEGNRLACARPVEVSAHAETSVAMQVPERSELELEARTQRAFEVQRFIMAGYDPADAARRYASGEILPPVALSSTRAAPRPPLSTQWPPNRETDSPEQPVLSRQRSVSETEREERERRVEDVMNFTGIERIAAEEALAKNDWVTESAVNSILDGAD